MEGRTRASWNSAPGCSPLPPRCASGSDRALLPHLNMAGHRSASLLTEIEHTGLGCCLHTDTPPTHTHNAPKNPYSARLGMGISNFHTKWKQSGTNMDQSHWVCSCILRTVSAPGRDGTWQACPLPLWESLYSSQPKPQTLSRHPCASSPGPVSHGAPQSGTAGLPWHRTLFPGLCLTNFVSLGVVFLHATLLSSHRNIWKHQN